MIAKDRTPPPQSSIPDADTAINGRDANSRSEAETALVRLAEEARLVEELLTHIGERHNEVRPRIESLHQRLVRMDDTARVENGSLLAGEAAVIESRLTRLCVAAGLAGQFAQLRAVEAGDLTAEARRPRGDAVPEPAAGDEETQRGGGAEAGGAVGGAA